MATAEEWPIFITYAREDRPFVVKLRSALESRGLRSFSDMELVAGQNVMRELQSALDSSSIVLFVMSPDSLKSPFSFEELGHALASQKLIIPIFYRDVAKLPAPLGELQWVDFRQESKFIETVDTLFKDINYYLEERSSHADARDSAGDHGEDRPGWRSDTTATGVVDTAPAHVENGQSSPQSSASDTLRTSARLSGYCADDVAGRDLLNIRSDVHAFATLIAARRVSPPLSIGLFGEWGSGKSFFMRQLRKAVQDICEHAQRSDKLQREMAFYKHIVQIEFNAWQYMEGNLWASLVAHIFRSLTPASGRNDAVEQVQSALATQLREKVREQQKASAEALKAENALTAAQKAVEQAEAAYSQASEKLNDVTAMDVVQLAFDSPEVKRDIGSLQDQLGI